MLHMPHPPLRPRVAAAQHGRLLAPHYAGYPLQRTLNPGDIDVVCLLPRMRRQMPKREAERLASEIWAFKDQQDAAAATPISLDEATAVFLERRFFAIPRLVTEVRCAVPGLGLGPHPCDKFY